MRRSKVRDTQSDRIELWAFAGWQLDASQWLLTAPDGGEVALTRGEFRLLLALVQQKGRLVDRDQLLSATAGEEADVYDRSIDAIISRLRRKLGDHGGRDLIRTVRGEGYQLGVSARSAG
ncbi:winged helix-turn-helix domain-containing protein [Sphingopyxis sp.]|uniref:winged helix-turn-helix domain-containing protein n=1 Tax=Sphingopyxis sp. TaxID=1908224 RepID=UPI003BAA4072